MASSTYRRGYVCGVLGRKPRIQRHLYGFASKAGEKSGLIDHLQRFLLELGQGFAFVGRQVPLEIGERDFRLDLLFYHLKLRCYVVIELKTGRFEPEYIGKLNMYLNAVDNILSYADDKSSIGLLLVKERDRLVVEYTLAGTSKPMGVARWEREITRSLPEELKASLPTVEEIEAELWRADDGES